MPNLSKMTTRKERYFSDLGRLGFSYTAALPRRVRYPGSGVRMMARRKSERLRWKRDKINLRGTPA